MDAFDEFHEEIKKSQIDITFGIIQKLWCKSQMSTGNNLDMGTLKDLLPGPGKSSLLSVSSSLSLI